MRACRRSWQAPRDKNRVVHAHHVGEQDRLRLPRGGDRPGRARARRRLAPHRRHLGRYRLRPRALKHREAPARHAQPAGGRLGGAERAFHGVRRGVRAPRHRDVHGAADAPRHGRPPGVPARARHVRPPAGAGGGAHRERERHHLGRADPLRRQRYAGSARGMPRGSRPHGHPLGHRGALRCQPASPSRREPHRPRRGHRPRDHGRGGRSRHHGGLGRHDHEDQGCARAHGGRHPACGV